MKMIEFSGSHLLQTQTGHDVRILYVYENNYQFGKPFLQLPWKALLNEAGPYTQTLKHTHSEFFTHILSPKIPLGARFIGVVIGFITPLHHSAALPFAMVDEPLRPSQTWPSKGLGVGERRKGRWVA